MNCIKSGNTPALIRNWNYCGEYILGISNIKEGSVYPTKSFGNVVVTHFKLNLSRQQPKPES
jgi:hypothetical protein